MFAEMRIHVVTGVPGHGTNRYQGFEQVMNQVHPTVTAFNPPEIMVDV